MQEMCFFATKSSMKIRMKRKLAVVLLICISCHIGWAAQDFVWKSGQNMKVVCDTTEAPVVKVALDLLRRDCRSVLSGNISRSENTGNIYVGTWGESSVLQALADTRQLDVAQLDEHREAFLLNVLPDGRLVVAGSDKRGTAYGVLELSRMMGVSPWEWWADAVPEKKRNFVCLQVSGNWSILR